MNRSECFDENYVQITLTTFFILYFSTRPFNVYSTNIGNPTKISIRKDTKGLISTDWYLEKVIILYFENTNLLLR